MPIGKEIISPCGQKSESPRSCSFLGFLLILLQWIRNHQVRVVLLAAIYPFANIVGNYACRTGDKKRDYNIHAVHLLPLSGIGWTTQVLYHRTMRTERLDLKHILGWGYNINMPGWSNKVRNHPKENKKAFAEQYSMFFVTHLQHTKR